MKTVIGTDITFAKLLLEKDELVAIPTETVYGLAGNALSPVAVTKIFEVKNRPSFNPLILHIKSIDEIEKYAIVKSEYYQFLQEFMPGPFTILLPKRDNIPDILTAGSDKVAIRVPQHPLTQQLLHHLDFPLAAPSANPFGYVSPTSAQHVYENLQNKIPYVLDGGEATIGIESTIAEIKNDQLIIHRLGGKSVENIQEHSILPVILVTQTAKFQTSGQLKSHYATSTPLYLGNVAELIYQQAGKKIAVISFYTDYSGTNVTTFPLSTHRNLTEAAATLFKTMREIDQLNFNIIIAEHFPEEGLGRAINDRLKRAQFIYRDETNVDSKQ